MAAPHAALPIEQFGRALVTTGDLDPVYGALVGLVRGEPRLDNQALARWLVWYWCTYDCGSACWASEQGDADWWGHLGKAAVNELPSPLGGRWPRAPERRHWRGRNAVSSANDLFRRWATSLDMVEYLAHGRDGPGAGPEPYRAVRARVQEHEGFGPWIAYKCADMLERVWGVPVAFAESDAMYAEPVKGALAVYRERIKAPPGARVLDEGRAVRAVVQHLLAELRDLGAPGLPGRRVGLQEVETVLCKGHTHSKGRYPVGHDIDEIRRGVEPWARVSPTAAAFLNAMPPPVTAEAVARAAGRG